MKFSDVYALLRAELAQPLKTLGFKRQKSFLSWARTSGQLCTVVWCQVSQDGWDAFAGSKFTVDLQRSASSEPGAPSSHRARLGKLLPQSVLDEIFTYQNSVIRALPRPPNSHPVLCMAPNVREWYLRKFEPEQAPYNSETDVWLRYAAPDHVTHWGRLLAQHLGPLVQAVEREA